MTEDQNTEANEAQTENIVNRILTSNVKYGIGVLVFLAGVVAPYYTIKQDVALIKENHYTHIEAMTKQIEANSEQINEMKEKEQELMKIIIANQTKLEILMKE